MNTQLGSQQPDDELLWTSLSHMHIGISLTESWRASRKQNDNEARGR